MTNTYTNIGTLDLGLPTVEGINVEVGIDGYLDEAKKRACALMVDYEPFLPTCVALKEGALATSKSKKVQLELDSWENACTNFAKYVRSVLPERRLWLYTFMPVVYGIEYHPPKYQDIALGVNRRLEKTGALKEYDALAGSIYNWWDDRDQPASVAATSIKTFRSVADRSINKKLIVTISPWYINIEGVVPVPDLVIQGMVEACEDAEILLWGSGQTKDQAQERVDFIQKIRSKIL